MTAPWYDTHEGITVALERDLQGLHDLHRARATAGYDRRERLSRWLVLGRYLFDQCGNLFPLDTPFVGRPLAEENPQFEGAASMRPLAVPGIVCSRCGQGWTLADAHDYRRSGDDRDQHEHLGCRRYAVADLVRAQFGAAVNAAGLPGDLLLAVPNRYGDGSFGPWFTTVTERLGRITIGWRSRVIQVEWEHGPDGRELFAAERVTVGTNYVHAWNLDKLAGYLRALVSEDKTPT